MTKEELEQGKILEENSKRLSIAVERIKKQRTIEFVTLDLPVDCANLILPVLEKQLADNDKALSEL